MSAVAIANVWESDRARKRAQGRGSEGQSEREKESERRGRRWIPYEQGPLLNCCAGKATSSALYRRIGVCYEWSMIWVSELRFHVLKSYLRALLLSYESPTCGFRRVAEVFPLLAL